MSELDLYARYLDMGAKLGKSGDDLAAWVEDKVRQDMGRIVRQIEREKQREERESQRHFECKKLEMKTQLKKIELESKHNVDTATPRQGYSTQKPKIPLLSDPSQACDEDFVAYVKDRSPSDMVSLKAVASAYIDARPNKSFSKKPSVSFSAKADSEPCRPSVRAYDKGNSRSNWPRSQRGVGRGNYPSQGHRSPSSHVTLVQGHRSPSSQGYSGSGRSGTSHSPFRDRNRPSFNTRSVGKGQQFRPNSTVVLVWPRVVMTLYVISVVAGDMCGVSAQVVQRKLILLVQYLSYLLIVVLLRVVVVVEVI
ncbi:hypothetical protein PoB_005794000 [Plakobranchus ocellatus]|uniref:Uncharacterized protein n=1 Tax=Plakobranchus ocellatus TaxID=259542 RepID=A0AAV4CF34_9GAST|nr:hypothetical protein PoB_005794000 [Plakobranchus ocellatus]